MLSVKNIFSINKMAESNDLTWEADNNFIPKYIPEDLKWSEIDELDTRLLRNKCEEFLNNTDLHFAKRHVVNFDMIKNDITEETKKQYQTIDHDEIKRYPVEFQEQICSSIFRNSQRKDMHIQKKTINEHFSSKKPSLGRGRFFKKIKENMYRDSW